MALRLVPFDSKIHVADYKDQMLSLALVARRLRCCRRSRLKSSRVEPSQG